MRHVVFEENNKYLHAILIKTEALNQKDLKQYYLSPLNDQGIPSKDVIAFSLEYNEFDKCPLKFARSYLEVLLKALDSLGTKTLYVCDGTYFKALTKKTKVNPYYGSVVDCTMKGYEHMKIIVGVNHRALFYNPMLQEKIDLSLETLCSHIHGCYTTLGQGIIHSACYPDNSLDIETTLHSLKKYPKLTCDIETFSLKFYRTGIATIAFAWDKHNGTAFCCDYHDNDTEENKSGIYGSNVYNPRVNRLLLEFFTRYKGTIIFHNANFDCKIIIKALWMRELMDWDGMLDGLETLFPKIEDTKLIAYLATNSCAGNNLKLKDLAHEYTGNYAQDDINDIRLIPPKELLEYNLIDCFATWYVYDKYKPIMIKDKQEQVYKEIMLPSVKVLLHTELIGMPLNITKVYDAKEKLQEISVEFHSKVMNHPLIKEFTLDLRKERVMKDNLLLKKKVRTLKELWHLEFNPGSNIQLAKLIFDTWEYEVIDKTDKGAPSVGAKTLKKLLHKVDNASHTAIIEAVIGYSEVSKILNTFIKAFRYNSVKKDDGWFYLHGNFNIGGTVSGRLSSSGPNLQNLPSTGTIYAKIIKECFVAPKGWIFAGADFHSLEDRISALTTKDPQKIKVYTDGFDGHCLRAFSYFGDQMEDIDESVTSINSIKDKYPDFRQDSKGGTFLLTYGGTYHGMISNLGWKEDKAKKVEENYHILYKVSDDWVKNRINQATHDGFVTVAFGLRVRTPILKQTILDTKITPREAQAEARTAGNALGQSCGLLNNRASIEFQKRLLASEHRTDVLPCAYIHDSIYLLIRDNVKTVKWVNDNLIECMQWQDLPELIHPKVKLGGELELFNSGWHKAITLPNEASEQEIIDICKK